jgi:hypothetical protein
VQAVSRDLIAKRRAVFLLFSSDQLPTLIRNACELFGGTSPIHRLIEFVAFNDLVCFLKTRYRILVLNFASLLFAHRAPRSHSGIQRFPAARAQHRAAHDRRRRLLCLLDRQQAVGALQSASDIVGRDSARRRRAALNDAATVVRGHAFAANVPSTAAPTTQIRAARNRYGGRRAAKAVARRRNARATRRSRTGDVSPRARRSMRRARPAHVRFTAKVIQTRSPSTFFVLFVLSRRETRKNVFYFKGL